MQSVIVTQGGWIINIDQIFFISITESEEDEDMFDLCANSSGTSVFNDENDKSIYSNIIVIFTGSESECEELRDKILSDICGDIHYIGYDKSEDEDD